jgi:hypothetical protein
MLAALEDYGDKAALPVELAEGIAYAMDLAEFGHDLVSYINDMAAVGQSCKESK